MKRIFGVLFAIGVGAASGAARAQELELKQPRLTAKTTCTPSLQARCSGIAPRGLDQDIACDRCAAEVMPADIVSSPGRVSTPTKASKPPNVSTPAKSERPPECVLGMMPLGVTAPGCLRPPIDNISLP